MSNESQRALDGEGTRPVWVVGKVVGGRYRLEQPVGRGAMGVVWRAWDETIEQTVAIKQLPPEVAHDPQGLRQLKAEAKTAMGVSHPGVVRVHNLEESAEGPFLVMEYVEGESLAARLSRQRTLDPDEVGRIGGRLCEALEEAHRAGVIHRDIKPGNILITKDGAPKLADFGIACSLRETMHRVSRLDSMGTLPYMAPEQIRGRTPTIQTDLYQLGATLYECLAGQTPFHQGALEWQILNEPPPPLEGVPEALAAAVLGTLAKDPAQRPRDAGALARLLSAEAGGGGIRAEAADVQPFEVSQPAPERVTPGREPELPWWRRNRGLVAGGTGAVVVLVVAAGSFALWGPRGSAQAPVTTAPPPSVTTSQGCTAAVAPSSPSAPPPAPATLEVRAEPPGAEIHFEWQPVGNTTAALEGRNRRGLLVVTKDGYQAAYRVIGPGEAGPVRLRLTPDVKRPHTRVLLVAADGAPAEAVPILRARLTEERFTVLGEDETREFERERRRAGGLSNRALRAWTRARFDTDLVLTARIRQAVRDVGAQDLGYAGLRDAAKGIVRSEVTVELEAVDLGSGEQLATVSGTGSGFALDRAQSLQKAYVEALPDSARLLRERLRL